MFLDGAPAGSFVARGLREDDAEAFVFSSYLPTLPRSFEKFCVAQGSDWADPRHVDIWHASLMAIGKARCQVMRRSFTRLVNSL